MPCQKSRIAAAPLTINPAAAGTRNDVFIMSSIPPAFLDRLLWDLEYVNISNLLRMDSTI
jgi:hypothetical protein